MRLSLTRLIGRGCVAKPSSCLIVHRRLDPHQYPHLLWTQPYFRQPAVPSLPSVFYWQSTGNRPVIPPPHASILSSTPISNKTSGNHSYASETHNRDSANFRLAQETSGLFLGGMPPQQFWKDSFQSAKIPHSFRTRRELSRASQAQRKRSICIPHL